MSEFGLLFTYVHYIFLTSLSQYICVSSAQMRMSVSIYEGKEKNEYIMNKYIHLYNTSNTYIRMYVCIM